MENPARAAGRLVPDIALFLATAGAGAAGRGARSVEKAADVAEDLRAVERAADATEEARAAKRAADLADDEPRVASKIDEERRLRLRRDPDKGFKIDEQSIKEANIAEDLDERGILPGLERPTAPGQGDFVGPNGQHWDIKGPMSRKAIEDNIRAVLREKSLPEPTFDPSRPFRGQFEIHEQMANVREVLDEGMKVILDTRGLNQADLKGLKQAIDQEGIGDRILWYP